MTPKTSSDGILVVDKLAGPTSHDVVIAVRRALGTRRVGHAGTLDPFATGVLACFVDRATRLTRFFAACEKTYEGVIRFGWATDTGDATGKPLGAPVARAPDDAQLRRAVQRLSGRIEQVPPMYSAKKRGGVPLHVLARAGHEVERAPVEVVVRDWTLTLREPEVATFRVTCSAGTYVRTLVSDMGSLVGVPAHLAELRRVTAGPFRVEEALAADALSPETARAALLRLDSVVLPMPCARLGADASSAFVHGRSVEAGAWRVGEEQATLPREGGQRVGVRSDGVLLGVGRIDLSGALVPEVVLVAAG